VSILYHIKVDKDFQMPLMLLFMAHGRLCADTGHISRTPIIPRSALGED